MAVELVAGEKVKGESKNAVIACNDYLRMGPTRSLRSLVARYRESEQKLAPTLSVGTLNNWSTAYGWQARADIYDAAIEAEKNAAEKERLRLAAERRKAIMETGVALDYERVDRLKRMADFLEEQLFYQPQPTVDDPELARRLGIEALLGLAEGEHDPEALDEIARRIVAKLDPNDPKNKFVHLWAREIKGLAGGRTVETIRFNSALLDALRATMADIAAETGGRRQRTITENYDIDLSKLNEEQLERITAGEDPLQVIISDYLNSGKG